MAGKPDTRELAHEAIGSARLTAFGVSLSRLSRRHTPVVAIGCVAALGHPCIPHRVPR
jgi:hypothetical protein